MDTRDDRIRELAHRLWEESGRPDGEADRHWQKAQQIITEQEGEQSDLEPPAPSTEPVSDATPVVISTGGG